MANKEISVQQVRVYQYMVANAGRWVTSGEVASSTGVAGRTARLHLAKLAGHGILAQATVFPGHRYIYTGETDEGSAEQLARLDEAARVFGMMPS